MFTFGLLLLTHFIDFKIDLIVRSPLELHRPELFFYGLEHHKQSRHKVIRTAPIWSHSVSMARR